MWVSSLVVEKDATKAVARAAVKVVATVGPTDVSVYWMVALMAALMAAWMEICKSK